MTSGDKACSKNRRGGGARKLKVPATGLQENEGIAAVYLTPTQCYRTMYKQEITTRQSETNLISLSVGHENYNLHFGFGRFWAGLRPNLAPRPVPTGRALKMVQNAPQMSPQTNSKAAS